LAQNEKFIKDLNIRARARKFTKKEPLFLQAKTQFNPPDLQQKQNLFVSKICLKNYPLFYFSNRQGKKIPFFSNFDGIWTCSLFPNKKNYAKFSNRIQKKFKKINSFKHFEWVHQKISFYNNKKSSSNILGSTPGNAICIWAEKMRARNAKRKTKVQINQRFVLQKNSFQEKNDFVSGLFNNMRIKRNSEHNFHQQYLKIMNLSLFRTKVQKSNNFPFFKKYCKNSSKPFGYLTKNRYLTKNNKIVWKRKKSVLNFGPFKFYAHKIQLAVKKIS